MAEIEDLGVTVEEYLEAQAGGIDLLKIKGLEAWGIPREYVMELITLVAKVQSRTATEEEVVRELCIMSPPIRQLNFAPSSSSWLDGA